MQFQSVNRCTFNKLTRCRNYPASGLQNFQNYHTPPSRAIAVCHSISGRGLRSSIVMKISVSKNLKIESKSCVWSRQQLYFSLMIYRKPESNACTRSLFSAEAKRRSQKSRQQQTQTDGINLCLVAGIGSGFGAMPCARGCCWLDQEGVARVASFWYHHQPQYDDTPRECFGS